MADDVDEIRKRVHIVDLVSEKVALKRSGKNWMGLCPFHDDKNPSFTVSDHTGRYKCWSCGAGGDIFTWVMETQRVEFKDAMEILADRCKYELTGKGSGEKSKRASYRQANDVALQYFRESLAKDKVALDYCARRGLDELTRETWEIGYAPSNNFGLANALKKAGVHLADGAEMFLLKGDPQRGYEDLFKERLMFSVRDESGRNVVAFGGRLLGQGNPKYINTSTTPIFHKSRVLYGMHRALETIRTKDTAVLVEGYMDVIACHKAGVTNAVASMGTAFTEEQVALLKRNCTHVVILYDSDEAGQKATLKASEMLQAAGVHVRVAQMAQGQDPDTLLREVGPEAVVRAVEGGLTKIEFELARLGKRLQPAQEEYWDEVVEILTGCRTELELEKHVEELGPQNPAIKDPVEARNALRSLVIRAARAKKVAARKGADAEPAPKVVTKHKPMSGPEKAVLRGFLSEEFRTSCWEVLLESSLFVSPQAEIVAVAVGAAYAEEAPEGPATLWLPRLGSDASNILSELEMKDFLTRITDQVIEDAISRLVTARETRERLRQTSAGGLTLEQHEAIRKQVAERKVDKQAEDTEDFSKRKAPKDPPDWMKPFFRN